MLRVDLVVPVRTVLCGDSILFSWGNQQTVHGIPDAGSPEVGQSQDDARAVAALTTDTVSMERRNYFLHLFTLDLADGGWGRLCGQGSGSPPLLWILCRVLSQQTFSVT